MSAFVLLSPMETAMPRPYSPLRGSDGLWTPTEEKDDWGGRMVGSRKQALSLVNRRRLLWVVPTACFFLTLLTLANTVGSGRNALRRPLTPLGMVAEQVYSTVGSTRLSEYRTDLLVFYRQHLTHPSQPEPKLETLVPRKLPVGPSDDHIPRVIHQTNRNGLSRSEALEIWAPRSWRSLNPGYDYTLSNDAEADAWVHEQFPAPRMQKLWRDLAHVPVMRADLWRYLRLVRLGGIYSDMDTRCLRPIANWDSWHGLPAGGEFENEWMLPPASRSKPKIVVGIEADVGNRSDWNLWWPRPIQLVQWTIAATPQHPILIDTIRRISSSILDVRKLVNVRTNEGTAEGKMSAAEQIMRVVKMTGPGPFTDSVLRYLGVVSGGRLDWRDLRQVPDHGLRVMDLLILPISAFSPGIQNMGAHEIDYEGAYVHHGFAGTWKPTTEDSRT